MTGRAVVFTPLLDTGPPGLRDVGKVLTIRSSTFKSGGVNRRPRQMAPPSQAPFAFQDPLRLGTDATGENASASPATVIA